MHDRYYLQILNTCQELHMEVTGTGPPVDFREYKLTWLDQRRSTWIGPTLPYDSAVLMLIDETLREWNR